MDNISFVFASHVRLTLSNNCNVVIESLTSFVQFSQFTIKSNQISVVAIVRRWYCCIRKYNERIIRRAFCIWCSLKYKRIFYRICSQLSLIFYFRKCCALDISYFTYLWHIKIFQHSNLQSKWKCLCNVYLNALNENHKHQYEWSHDSSSSYFLCYKIFRLWLDCLQIVWQCNFYHNLCASSFYVLVVFFCLLNKRIA